MKANSNLANLVENEKIVQLRTFLAERLDCTTDEGKPDIAKIMNNAALNMSDTGNELGALIMQEKIKLSRLQRKLKETRSKVYQELMTSRLQFTATQKGYDTMTEGDPTVAELTEKIDVQQAYVDFLLGAFEQVKYYSRNADVMVRLHNVLIETGKLI